MGFLVGVVQHISLLDPLIKAQKALLRVINRKPLRYPSEQLFHDFSVPDVRQTFAKAIILYYHKHTELHQHRTHTIKTRSITNRNHKVPKTNSTHAQRHLLYLAPSLFNKIKDVPGINAQGKLINKKRLTHWLVTQGRQQTERLISFIPT